MANKTLLIVAAKTGYQTHAFAQQAEQLGYGLRMATDRCNQLDNPWGDDAIPLKFDRPEDAGEGFVGQSFDGIVAVGDKPAHIAAIIAERLGIPFHPPEAVAASRNKFEARCLFAAAGLPVPGYRRVPLDANRRDLASAVRYPCVLKPLGLSGSRGVIRADNALQFGAAFERIRALLALPEIRRLREEHDQYLLVEDFIPGREFAVEGIMTHGSLDLFAIFDKPDPLDGPFFEETIYVTPSREPEQVQDAIRNATEKAVCALGLRHGPVHSEMRVNERGVWMLEVAGRPIGGLCAAVLKFAGGESLEELILRHAAGEYHKPLALADPARGVMMIPIPKDGIYTGVSGVGQAQRVLGVEEVIVTAKEGQRLMPLPEGSSYLGFIFSRGENPLAAEQALRTAGACLEFEIAGVLPVL
jgi:biotin carboxylase